MAKQLTALGFTLRGFAMPGTASTVTPTTEPKRRGGYRLTSVPEMRRYNRAALLPCCVNKVILVGNLGRDPEARHTQDGRPICNFTVATNETRKDRQTGEGRERVEWHCVVVFDEPVAEVAQNYLRNGSKVYLEVQLQTRKWTRPVGAGALHDGGSAPALPQRAHDARQPRRRRREGRLRRRRARGRAPGRSGERARRPGRRPVLSPPARGDPRGASRSSVRQQTDLCRGAHLIWRGAP